MNFEREEITCLSYSTRAIAQYRCGNNRYLLVSGSAPGDREISKYMGYIFLLITGFGDRIVEVNPMVKAWGFFLKGFTDKEIDDRVAYLLGVDREQI